MFNLRAVLQSEWEKALDTNKSVSPPEVVDRVIASYPELIREEQERLIREAMLRWVKSLAKDDADGSGQLQLFGFPRVIAVPNGTPEDYRYMRATKATYDDLEAGLQVRDENVERAVAKRDTYMAALEKVRPLLQGTGRTLADLMEAEERRESAA